MPIQTPSLQDIAAPFDPTAYAQISGAQLLQLVSGATPYADKGLVVTTADINGVPQIPDAATNTKWQKYLWLRIQATLGTIYYWNPGGTYNYAGAGFEYWYPVAINIALQSIIGSVPGGAATSMISPSSLGPADINSVNWSQIAGVPNTIFQSTTPLGGVLSGYLPAPAFAAQSITTAALFPGCVTAAIIAGQCVSLNTHLNPAGWPALGHVRLNAAGSAFECVTKLITQIAEPAGVGNYLVQVNAGNTAFGYVQPNGSGGTLATTLGRVLQEVIVVDSTAESTASTMSKTGLWGSATDGAPTTNLNKVFTPLSANSTLIIEVDMQLGIGSTGVGQYVGFLGACIFASTQAAPIAGKVVGCDATCAASPGLGQFSVCLRAKLVPGSVAPITFTTNYGAIVGQSNLPTVYYNASNTVEPIYAGNVCSSLKITEIL